MDILGITPLEVIVIVILGLIVFGPERLPEIGRFIGRMLARLLAWQQQSPEAQMIQQIRKDFDREILELRDEIIRARQQLDISTETQQVFAETQALLSVKEVASKPVTIRPAAGTRAVHQAAAAEAGSPDQPVAPTQVDTLDPPIAAAAKRPTSATVNQAGTQSSQLLSAVQGQHNPTSPEHSTQALLQRLEALSSDMQALQAQLYARGVLDPDWRNGAPTPDLDIPLSEKEVRA